MAIAKVSKINIIALLEDREKILQAIQDAGLLQVAEHSDTEAQNPAFLAKADLTEIINKNEYKLAGARFGLSFLAEYDTKKKKLSEKLILKKQITKEQVEEKAGSFKFKTFKIIQAAQSGINEAENIIEKTKSEISRLSAWKDLDFIPNIKDFPKQINYRLLVLPIAREKDFSSRLNQKMPLSELRILEKNKKEARASLIYHNKEEEVLTDILNALCVKIEEIPEIATTVSEHIDYLEKKIIKAQGQLKEEKNKAFELAARIPDLKIIFDYLTWERSRLLAMQKTAQGQKFFSLIGWMETEKIKILEEKIAQVGNNFFIKEIEPAQGEIPPTAYKNTRLASPFEFITGIYGPPKNGSPDPTPFLAPFFILFFGLCLTDAGYGVVLALLAWLGIKFVKPGKEAVKMLKVLMFGGLATFAAGVAVGGWFGIVIDDFGEGWLKSIITGARLIDPIKDPIAMLLFSLGLGVIQVFAGMVISIWWKLKNKKIASAVLDDGLWLYFLIAMLVWTGDKFGVVDFGLARYFVWIGAIGLIATQGRKDKHPALKLAKGILSLYGLVGYLSDVLSYSRLLALGLATGIIAMVVNLIASLTVDLVPYLGYVIAALVIIGGHIFNIAINALGSFIHSSRLQFVEFFPKFMEGGGVNFEPVKKESKYTKIIK